MRSGGGIRGVVLMMLWRLRRWRGTCHRLRTICSMLLCCPNWARVYSKDVNLDGMKSRVDCRHSVKLSRPWHECGRLEGTRCGLRIGSCQLSRLVCVLPYVGNHYLVLVCRQPGDEEGRTEFSGQFSKAAGNQELKVIDTAMMTPE